MVKFLLRLLVTALSLGLATWFLPGVAVAGPIVLLIAALLFGFVNALVRPVLFILTFPLTLMTLGLFLLVLNAAMLGLVAWILPGFYITGFWSALFCWILVSIFSTLGNQLVGTEKR